MNSAQNRLPFYLNMLLTIFVACCVMMTAAYICKTDTRTATVLQSLDPVVEKIVDIYEIGSRWTESHLMITLTLLQIPFVFAVIALFRNSRRAWNLVLASTPLLFGFILLLKSNDWMRNPFIWSIIPIGAGLWYFLRLKPENGSDSLHANDCSVRTAVILLPIIIALAFTIRIVRLDTLPKLMDGDAGDDMSCLIHKIFYEDQSPFRYFIVPRDFKTQDETWYMTMGALAFKYWGIGLLTIRMTTALYGVLTVALFYLLLSYGFGRGYGLIGAFLLAVMPLHASFSRYGHTFHMPLILFCLEGFFALKFIRSGRFRFAVLTGFVTGWTYAFHLSALAGLFVVPGFFISEWAIKKTSRKMIMKTIMCLLLGGIIGSFFFWIIIDEYHFSRTLTKGIAPTSVSKKLVSGQKSDPIQNLSRNFYGFCGHFWNRHHYQGYFFSGGDQYFVKSMDRLGFQIILIGFMVWGLGWILGNWRDPASRFFILMILCVPIPGLLSMSFPKRLLGFALIICGLTAISIREFFASWKAVISPRIRNVIVIPALFGVLITLFHGVDGVFNSPNPSLLKYHYDYADAIAQDMEDGYFIILSCDPVCENIIELFTHQFIEDNGGNQKEFYKLIKLKHLYEVLSVLAEENRAVAIYVQQGNFQPEVEKNLIQFAQVTGCRIDNTNHPFISMRFSSQELNAIFGWEFQNGSGTLDKFRNQDPFCMSSAMAGSCEGYLWIPEDGMFEFSATGVSHLQIDISAFRLQTGFVVSPSDQHPVFLRKGYYETCLELPLEDSPVLLSMKSSVIPWNQIPSQRLFPRALLEHPLLSCFRSLDLISIKKDPGQ